ncbi:hypothetical protein EDD86DRAFT_208620 [Gorgonomyces haynaldii]|nr:hypothetical protein EDD86DRAFT_208620 [Gorgonomyces haynaldii]
MNSFETKLEEHTQKLKESLLQDLNHTLQLHTQSLVLEHQQELKRLQEQVQLKTNLVSDGILDLKQKESKIESKNRLLEAILKHNWRRNRIFKQERLWNKWKQRYSQRKQERLVMRLAAKHHKRSSLKKALSGWKMQTGHTWKQQCERTIHREAERHLTMMSHEYEQQIRALEAKLGQLTRELEACRVTQIKQQEEMRRSFLRGVSAMNQEALELFKDDNFQQTSLDNATQLLIRAKKNPIYGKTYVEKTGDSFQRTNGLVTRHFD